MNFVLRLWLLHYLIYYTLFASSMSLIASFFLDRSFNLRSVLVILVSPLAAVFGLYDGLIIIFPILLYLLFKKWVNQKRAYLLSTFTCYTLLHLYLVVVEDFTYSFVARGHNDKVNINNFIIVGPCLAITILIILFTYKKHFKKT